MQNSEIYRQGVVLPLDQKAQECLSNNDVDSFTNVRVLEIPGDEVFSNLWKLGLFKELNAKCGTEIDEYEEEWVGASATADVLAVVESLVGTAHEPAVIEFLSELRALVVHAHALSRPLLFVL